MSSSFIEIDIKNNDVYNIYDHSKPNVNVNYKYNIIYY